jgi:hypothetical protein
MCKLVSARNIWPLYNIIIIVPEILVPCKYIKKYVVKVLKSSSLCFFIKIVNKISSILEFLDLTCGRIYTGVVMP